MNKFKLVLFIYFLTFSVFTYAEVKNDEDSIAIKKKKIWTTSSLFGAATISQVALYQTWYSSYNSGSFHFFNDWNEWRKMDKLGHGYTAYHLSNSIFNLLSWSGYSVNKSIIISSTFSWAYQGFIEVMDGFSDGWGFSYTDLLFNTFGTGLFVFNKTTKSPFFFPKFSYSPSPYAQIRPEILGSNAISRVLKDYNAQTYWLSIKPLHILPKKHSWLLLSIGYSINEHIVGNQIDVTMNGQLYKSYSQLFFSIDIDPKALPIHNKTLKKLLYPLNYIKIPFPAFSIEKGRGKFYPIYF